MIIEIENGRKEEKKLRGGCESATRPFRADISLYALKGLFTKFSKFYCGLCVRSLLLNIGFIFFFLGKNTFLHESYIESIPTIRGSEYIVTGRIVHRSGILGKTKKTDEKIYI